MWVLFLVTFARNWKKNLSLHHQWEILNKLQYYPTVKYNTVFKKNEVYANIVTWKVVHDILLSEKSKL